MCEDKKAAEIVVLDLRKLTVIADYFVICSSTNQRQARAIANSLRVDMREIGKPQRSIEGMTDPRWLLQDFGDVIVHVFHKDHRDFYDLEGLWSDAPQVRWKRTRKKKA